MSDSIACASCFASMSACSALCGSPVSSPEGRYGDAVYTCTRGLRTRLSTDSITVQDGHQACAKYEAHGRASDRLSCTNRGAH